MKLFSLQLKVNRAPAEESDTLPQAELEPINSVVEESKSTAEEIALATLNKQELINMLEEKGIPYLKSDNKLKLIQKLEEGMGY